MKKNIKMMMTILGQESDQAHGFHLLLRSPKTQSQYPKFSRESQLLEKLDVFPDFYLRGHNLFFLKHIRSFFRLSNSESCAKTIELRQILEPAKRITIGILVKRAQRTRC